MDDGGSDELTFAPEQVEGDVYDVIESVLKEKIFDNKAVEGWIDEICSSIMKDLVAANRPYKYTVSTSIVQKNGAGYHSAHSCFWDAAQDNVLVARWPSEKRKDPNARVYCIVTIMAVTM